MCILQYKITIFRFYAKNVKSRKLNTPTKVMVSSTRHQLLTATTYEF